MPFSSEVISASSSGQITCAPKFSVQPPETGTLGSPLWTELKEASSPSTFAFAVRLQKGQERRPITKARKQEGPGFFPPRSPCGQGQPSLRDSGRGGVSPVCAARGPPRPRRLASCRSPPWPPDCSRPGMSPVLSTRSRANTFPSHQLTAAAQRAPSPQPSTRPPS